MRGGSEEPTGGPRAGCGAAAHPRAPELWGLLWDSPTRRETGPSRRVTAGRGGGSHTRWTVTPPSNSATRDFVTRKNGHALPRHCSPAMTRVTMNTHVCTRVHTHAHTCPCPPAWPWTGPSALGSLPRPGQEVTPRAGGHARGRGGPTREHGVQHGPSGWRPPRAPGDAAPREEGRHPGRGSGVGGRGSGAGGRGPGLTCTFPGSGLRTGGGRQGWRTMKRRLVREAALTALKARTRTVTSPSLGGVGAQTGDAQVGRGTEAPDGCHPPCEKWAPSRGPARSLLGAPPPRPWPGPLSTSGRPGPPCDGPLDKTVPLWVPSRGARDRPPARRCAGPGRAGARSLGEAAPGPRAGRVGFAGGGRVCFPRAHAPHLL